MYLIFIEYFLGIKLDIRVEERIKRGKWSDIILCRQEFGIFIVEEREERTLLRVFYFRTITFISISYLIKRIYINEYDYVYFFLKVGEYMEIIRLGVDFLFFKVF